jgi:hypothetical protein
MSRILIIGDSWGCGEWNYLCPDSLLPQGKNLDQAESIYCVSHRGLEKYLSDYGCYVHNLSKGKGTNMQALDYLDPEAERWPINYYEDPGRAYDYVFWFVTDPLRDHKVTSAIQAYTKEQMIRTIDHYMDLSLARANRIAQKHNFKTGIHVIGGLYSPSIKQIDKYEFIHEGCLSFMKLLYSEIPEGFKGLASLPSFSGMDAVNRKLNNISDILGTGAVDYLEFMNVTFKNIVINSEYFSVNYDCHPDRFAHEVLFTYLKHRFELTPCQG